MTELDVPTAAAVTAAEIADAWARQARQACRALRPLLQARRDTRVTFDRDLQDTSGVSFMAGHSADLARALEKHLPPAIAAAAYRPVYGAVRAELNGTIRVLADEVGKDVSADTALLLADDRIVQGELWLRDRLADLIEVAFFDAS